MSKKRTRKNQSTQSENVDATEIVYVEPDYEEAIGFGIGFLFGMGKL